MPPEEQPHQSILACVLPPSLMLVVGMGFEITSIARHSTVNFPGFVLILPSIALGIWAVATPTRTMVRVSWAIAAVLLLYSSISFFHFFTLMEPGSK